MTDAASSFNRPTAIVALAAELLDASKDQVAAELIERVGAEHPDYLGVRLLESRLEVSAGRPSEALAGALGVLMIDPLNADALAVELRARRALEQSAEEVGAVLRKLAAIAPAHPEGGPRAPAPTLATIGFMHLRQGRNLLAQRWLEDAIEEDGWPELRAAIAQLQLEDGQVRAALASAQSVLEQLPECLPANLVCAQAHAELGKLTLADKHLKRAGRYDPEFELARRFYARLPVSRLELPPAPDLELPEMLLARAQRALEPPPDPAAAPPYVPEPVGEYNPPSERFLPARDDAGHEDTDPGPARTDPQSLALSGQLARFIEEGQWPLVLELLESGVNLLDPGQLESLPRSGLPRLADELLRMDRPDLAAEAYRLAESQPPPADREATAGEPSPDN